MTEDQMASMPPMQHIGCVPYDPEVFAYVNWGEYVAHTYTNWREETLSWKENCYISTHLSCFPTLTISGPDVMKLLSHAAVNSFEKFPVGSCKHMILCTEKGNVMDHGLILRTGENEVTSFITPFYLLYQAEKNGFDVTIVPSEDDARNYVFQIAGPRSLEILEQALQEDIHDLKFMRFMYGSIAGKRVRILRMGMGGTLSYEVHGYGNEDGLAVHEEIMRVGEPYGIKRLGVNQYVCNHTENGFPQTGLHFPGAILDDPDFVDYMSKIDFYEDAAASEPCGTLSRDIHDYYRNPFELAWGHMVKFDHDFVGRAALEKLAKEGHRKMVTLVWNHEDIMKVFASFFQKGAEPYDDMPFPVDFSVMGSAENRYQSHKVLAGGKTVGASMWRTYTLYYREMISLCSLDEAYAEDGTEVTVLWGSHDGPQLEIRATVARYPYLDLEANKNFDMESIPRYGK